MSTTVQIGKSISSYELTTVKGRLCAQKLEITLFCLSVISFIALYFSGVKNMFSKGGKHVCGILLASCAIGFLLLIINQTCIIFHQTFLRRIKVETDQEDGQTKYHLVTLQ